MIKPDRSSSSGGPLLHHKIAYVSPIVSTSFLIGPLAILQGIYAKYFGLSLSIIALVLVLSRLFDAITDPIIGHWSDYHHNRSGSRKPFILYGGLLFIISGYFLYVPPENVSPVYFLGWFLAFYLTYTMVEIPHLAWARELAKNTHDIGLLYGWRALSVFLGSLLFYAIASFTYL